MRLLALALAAGLVLCACISPPGDVRISQTRPDLDGYRAFSWGKAGVAFEDYDAIAFECTARGMLATPHPSKRDLPLYGPDPYMLGSVLFWREAALRDANRQRQEAVDACLTEFGFQRFGLTDEQVAQLETLPRGAPERRRYLHALGADPAILAAQRL